MHTKSTTILGDTLTVHWTGSVWVSPTNGQQHARAEQAMRAELEAYYLACGEDLDDESIQDEINDAIKAIADE